MKNKVYTSFDQAVADIPEVAECWAVGGGVDYFLKFICRDIDAYQRLVDRMLDADIGLKRYFSYVVTKSTKSRSQYPVTLPDGAGNRGVP